MLPIQEKLIQNRINRPALRDAQKYAIQQIKGIIAHWTANTNNGADADAHRRFFNNVPTYTSAHYFVDDKQIIRIIPDAEIAYHVGAKNYKTDGQGLIGDTLLTANYFVIGFEMCVNADGNWGQTYQNSVDLAAHLLHKYRFGINDLYRHFDITGKDCPRMMLSSSAWNNFRSDVGRALQKIKSTPKRTARVTAAGLNVRSGPSGGYPVVDILRRDAVVGIIATRGNWQQIDTRRWVYGAYLQTIAQTQDGLIQGATGANIRSGPGMAYPIVDKIPNGAWVSVLRRTGNWLNIRPDQWVYMSLVRIVQIDREEVWGTSFLNVRKGPSTRNPIVRVLGRGDRVEVFERQGAWKRIATDEWAYGAFLRAV